MHNAYCSGEYLYAIVEKLQWEGANSIEFQVADTLQCHNLLWQSKSCPEKAIERSLRTGEEWLVKNFFVLQSSYNFFQSVRVTRWNFWIKQSHFSDIHRSMMLLYDADSEFAECVIADAKDYLIRTGRSVSDDRLNHCVSFLLEEISVTELSARNSPANEVYPGPRPRAEDYLILKKAKDLDLRMNNIPYIEVVFHAELDKAV
jgi:hypothetical protein